MTARVALAAWGLALAAVALLVASLRGLALDASLGWSWFILASLATAAAAVALAADGPRPSLEGSP